MRVIVIKEAPSSYQKYLTIGDQFTGNNKGKLDSKREAESAARACRLEEGRSV